MSETRKLTTIVAADVVGYSRLTATDEERTVARLRALRGDLIDPAITAHHGRIVKRTGDGTLMEFRSVVDAVRCAIEVQNGMVERNAGLPPERQILFRVGIHLGDVIEEADGDLMGDGVNIAARLESICEPGAICISEDAYRQVRSRLDLAVSDLGAKDLKNIPEPVHVYSLEVGKPTKAKPAITLAPAVAPPPKKRSMLVPLVAGIAALLVMVAVCTWYFLVRSGVNLPVSAPAHLSIVVLPFQNLSGDPKQDYFADGVTDNLTTDLSRIRNSFVIARNTAFTYKGKAVDAKEIGKELGVRYVLEGSVARDGNRVRVNAQLIDAESGSHLWADRFEEDLADLFKLQDDVVARLANALGYELIKAEAEKAARSTNPDAIDLVMRGQAELRGNATREGTNAARNYFERALKLNPDNDDALGGAAAAGVRALIFGWSSSDDEKRLLVTRANRAIQLDPSNPQPYYAKAFYYALIAGDADEALTAAIAGLNQNPNSVELYFALSTAHTRHGEFQQAIADLRNALKLSPKDPALGYWHMSIGAADIGLGDDDAAIAEEHKALEAGVRTYPPYIIIAAAAALKGDKGEAKVALEQAKHIDPALTLKYVMAHTPHIEREFEGLRKAGLAEDEPPKHLSIVVLPFDNLSGDPKQDYFADGITDNLTTDLSRIRNSFVIARNTAFTYKGKGVDAKEIGKELGVRYVLEGSVARDGNRVRVNAQLIDAESGSHLWADRFEEDLADLFKLQDDVVARLARALQIELVNAESQKGLRDRPQNPDVIDLTMRGWALMWQPPKKDTNHAARDLFERALKADPKSDDALSGIAYTYGRDYVYGWGEDGVNYDEKIIGQADRAVALNPGNAMAYYMKSIHLSNTKRSEDGFAVADAGLRSDPNFAPLYAARAIAGLALGRSEQSRSDILQAMRLSPRDAQIGIWNSVLANVELQLGHDQAAIEAARNAIEEGLRIWLPYAELAAAYTLSGNGDGAGAALAEARRLNPELSIKWAMDHSPNVPLFFAGLREAGLPEDEGPRLSIVVLPFQNLSGDAKQDYLADVLTDELTTYISRIPGSFVIARNTAFTYKGKPTNAKEIGKDLGIRYMLEGSVQSTDKRIRINAQLIDTETGAHLWADEFDTDKTDLLETEDQIVTRLARSLDVALTEVEAAKGARVHPDNPDAQDLALRCSANVNGNLGVRDPEKLAVIYAPCEQALHLDPRNVLALGLLGWRHAFAVTRGASADVPSDIRQADELISRALAVDPNDSRILGAKGLLLTAQNRLDEAISWYERSISSNPSNVNAYSALCGSYNGIGQPKKALQYADAVIRLSPRDPIRYLFYFHKMWALFALQRDSEALEWANRTLALAPGSSLTLRYAIAELTRAGRDGEAREAYQRLVALPGNPIKTIAQLKTYDARTWPATDPGSVAARERLYAGLRKAGMPEQ